MVNLATPINQLPPAQPIANDPILVQEILKESMNLQNEQNLHKQDQNPQIQNHINPYNPYIIKSQQLQQNQYDYTSMIKNLILVSIMVFLVQMPTLKEYITLYIPQNDLNLLFRCLIAGISYVGLNLIF